MDVIQKEKSNKLLVSCGEKRKGWSYHGNIVSRFSMNSSSTRFQSGSSVGSIRCY
uniref:Uncharacterized protein LOC105132720 n=1 Tax=Rhizophora mucronata TaxID=61149 RepID=A0A2P2JCI9_RHIMU